jgi:hypothetical protein
MTSEGSGDAPAPEQYRVFRLQEATPHYIGTYAAPTPKEAVRQAVFADGSTGHHVYEAHLMRNAYLFEIHSRDERFIEWARPMNTALEVDRVLEGKPAAG